MLNFENCEKAIFSGVGKYEIPKIQPENIDIRNIEWIPFNYAMTAKKVAHTLFAKGKKGLLFVSSLGLFSFYEHQTICVL